MAELADSGDALFAAHVVDLTDVQEQAGSERRPKKSSFWALAHHVR